MPPYKGLDNQENHVLANRSAIYNTVTRELTPISAASVQVSASCRFRHEYEARVRRHGHKAQIPERKSKSSYSMLAHGKRLAHGATCSKIKDPSGLALGEGGGRKGAACGKVSIGTVLPPGNRLRKARLPDSYRGLTGWNVRFIGPHV